MNIRIENVAAFIQIRPTVAASNDRAPSLSCSPLRRQSSEIRTGCANERPSGSGEGSRAIAIPTPISLTVVLTVVAWLPPLRSSSKGICALVGDLRDLWVSVLD